jgi:hypothetical protein
MKVNRISGYDWPSDPNHIGGCVTLPGDGLVIAVQLVANAPDPLATIIHESVHVWQDMMEYMVEESPGNEVEAYTIEYIATTLMGEYQRLTGVSLAVHDKRKTRLQKGKREVQLSPGNCGSPRRT